MACIWPGGKLPGLGDHRTRVTTYLATPEYGPMPDFDHEAMIAHARVRDPGSPC